MTSLERVARVKRMRSALKKSAVEEVLVGLTDRDPTGGFQMGIRVVPRLKFERASLADLYRQGTFYFSIGNCVRMDALIQKLQKQQSYLQLAEEGAGT